MKSLEKILKKTVEVLKRHVNDTCSRPKGVCLTISIGLKDPSGILNSRRNLHALLIEPGTPFSIDNMNSAFPDVEKLRTYCMRNLQLSAPLQVRVVSSWILSTTPNGMLVRLTKELNTMHMIYPSLEVVETGGVSHEYI